MPSFAALVNLKTKALALVQTVKETLLALVVGEVQAPCPQCGLNNCVSKSNCFYCDLDLTPLGPPLLEQCRISPP